jgi:hypothetical protein
MSMSVVSRGQVSVADVAGEAVLLDLNSGQYFGLNRLGHEIFKLLGQPVSVPSIVSYVATKFGKEEGEIRSDVIDFLSALQDAELITTEAQNL